MDIQGYKIHRKIGEGAMAGVYLADQVSLGRPVALKVLAPTLAGQQGFTERFLKEGRIIAYLKHPQIVSVYDLGSSGHHYYLAMELLSGGTLEQKIKRGLNPAQAIQFIKEISQALGYAHDRGVIHRDIKSQNIMFRNDGIPVLTDFGIARLMDNDPHLTIPGRTIGSPLYMSPEQVGGHKIDARADLYSVGILLYKMLTNKMPYQSDQIITVAMMHKTAPIPVLPKELIVFQPILNRLLAKDPDQRYPNAQELITALDQLVSENSDLRRSPQPPTKQNQPAESFVADIQKAPSTLGDEGIVDSATQPIYESGDNLKANRDANPSEVDKSHLRGDNNDQGVSLPPHRPKFPMFGKIGLALGGGVIALVAVIFSMHFSQTVSKAPLPAATLALDAEKGADSIHHQTPEKQQAFHSIRPIQDQPVALPEEPKIEPPSVDQKIETLLIKAQGQLEKYKLTSPAGDNCYETYQQIRVLDPAGQQADSLLGRISQTYHRLALAAKKRGELNQSLSHVAKGLTMKPNEATLLALQDSLRGELLEKARIERARELELERQENMREADLASMEKRLNTEIRIESLRRQEAQRELNKIPSSEPEPSAPLPEPSTTLKEKIKIEPSKSAVEPTDNRKRLFGTF